MAGGIARGLAGGAEGSNAGGATAACFKGGKHDFAGIGGVALDGCELGSKFLLFCVVCGKAPNDIFTPSVEALGAVS